MIAAIPMNRVGAHFRTAPAGLPELPKSARERGQLWSDAVLHAVLTLKKQLTHQDVAIAAAAANSIIELERTRMRHGKSVAGSELVSEAQLQFEAEESRRYDRMGPPSAEKPEAEGARTNERAYAEHVREVTEYSEESEEPLAQPPEHFVRWLLNRWGLSANAVPKDGFLDRLREHGMGDGPAKDAA